MYDNEGVQVIVTTSEISREEVHPVAKSEVGRTQSIEASENSKQKVPATHKKPVKKDQKKRSRPKPQSKRDKRKGKKKSNKKQ